MVHRDVACRSVVGPAVPLPRDRHSTDSAPDDSHTTRPDHPVTMPRRTRSPAHRPLGPRYRRLLGAHIVSNLGDGVGTVAYPWLASVVTRQPLLVALVTVAQRLPWLVMTLPAGVITDRTDRRRTMITADAARGAITLLVALVVVMQQDSLPAPDAAVEAVGTRWFLYVVLLVATLALGTAEVLRDNTAQTFMPAIVDHDQLERANGRMWSLESVANTFLGPPFGSLLIVVSFSLPFVVDAASFFVAALLIAAIPGRFAPTTPPRADDGPMPTWRDDLVEGVRWLWAHDVLRPMAIILGLMNAAAMVSGATFVLFAQEVLDVGPLVFTIIGMGGAVGGIVGGSIASGLSTRLGSGTCLAITLGGCAVLSLAMAGVSWWPIAFVLFAVESLLGILWNVITVSLRQSVIPDHLLGRVNSVYRFFAWGMMPIGAAVGGLTVMAVDVFTSRDAALRATWIVNAAIHLVLFTVGRSRLTTERLEATRAAGAV